MTRLTSSCGVHGKKLALLRGEVKAGRMSVPKCVQAVLRSSADRLDGLVIAMAVTETEPFVAALAETFGRGHKEIEEILAPLIGDTNMERTLLTGAEALAFLLHRASVREVLAYPGTSELSICAAVNRLRSPVLRNSRGDAEAVFAASGACAAVSGSAVAVLHGARGSTNAVGALAHARRNEIGVVVIVGMCASRSQAFLPPHAENRLLESLGAFVKAHFELTEPSTFTQMVQHGFCETLVSPAGPVIFGLRQEMSENAHIPLSCVVNPWPVPLVRRCSVSDVQTAARSISSARRIVILVDDGALKADGKRHLLRFVNAVGAPLFQIKYRRGPMLFQQVTLADTCWYRGMWDPQAPAHRECLDAADLVITIEDRNMYPRVVGEMPAARKLAITSNGPMTFKNGYLRPEDIVLEGDIEPILNHLTLAVTAARRTVTDLPRLTQDKGASEVGLARALGRLLAGALTDAASKNSSVLLVDDSQMLGGVLAEAYERLPHNMRVVGDHSGFVGAGLASAAGAALVSRTTVWCLVGDQGYANAMQALVLIGESNVDVKIVIGNNGGSVSLRRQLASEHEHEVGDINRGDSKFLDNALNLSYAALARACGIPATTIALPDENMLSSWEHNLHIAMSTAVEAKGPYALELILPSDIDSWGDVWAVKGFDE